jgi:GNAT superfamily N-acetyltransferase
MIDEGAFMVRLVAVESAEDQARFCGLPGLSALTPEVVQRQRPQQSWLLLDDGGAVVGRSSLWWQKAPALPGQRVGLIGHYAVAGAEPAVRVLTHACERLAAAGCTLAVGPLDGTTWNRYRLLTERGTEPLFFLEPDNPDDWPGHFTALGFTTLASYYSAVTEDLKPPPGMDEVARRAGSEGMTWRNLNFDRFDDELRALHALSLDSFRQNFLYSPIGAEEFMALYRGVRPYARSDMILLLEQGDRLVGYLFGVPDHLQAKRGMPVDTAIIKTMAVHPDFMGQKLGGLLMARFHEVAAGLGFRRVIHALMHEENRSRKLSSHSARTIRRYTLYARALS